MNPFFHFVGAFIRKCDEKNLLGGGEILLNQIGGAVG